MHNMDVLIKVPGIVSRNRSSIIYKIALWISTLDSLVFTGDKETRQAAISRRRMTQSNLSWNWRQTIQFLTSKIPAPDPLDMYPCPIQMRAQSFQNFSRKAILKFPTFKSTNQRISTVGSSKPQPCPAQGCLFGRDTLIRGFESKRIPQMPLVEIFAPVMLRKLVLQLQDRFSREIMEGLSSHSDGAWIHI